MLTPDWTDLDSLLAAVHAKIPRAKEQLFAFVYGELRRIAGHLMRKDRPDHTLQPTALVHEAFLRLSQSRTLAAVPNRRYFFGAASRAMCQVLVDHAEARAAEKRGGGWERVPLDEVFDGLRARSIDALELRDALEQLGRLDERQAEIVTLKVCYEHTNREIAERLEVSEGTVERDWRLARSWLLEYLKGGAR